MCVFTHWDQELTTEFSNEILFALADRHLACVQQDTEAASDVALLLVERDLRGLCTYALSHDLIPSDHYHLSQIIAFFSKRDDLEIGFDKRDRAISKFKESEQLCKESNDIFRKWSLGSFCFDPSVESVLHSAQRKIASILGDVPCFSELKFRFGPGATTQLKRREASARRKLSSRFSCNPAAQHYLSSVAAECPDWFGVNPTGQISVDFSCEWEIAEFVPKNAKIDRKISKGPLLDVFVQLGLGDFMSDRLRRSGIDLRDQTLNQRLAREGSISGALATLDLSSASDTVSKGIVEHLLPYDWWDLLRAFRSDRIHLSGEELRLESFASMGNGFTFPLETLIFYALAHAVHSYLGLKDSPLAVYGDDIIVDVRAVTLMSKVLTACGFILNMEKSFWTGAFRESCGKDYVSGIDVRPCFMGSSLSGNTWFVLHNFYVRTNQPELAFFCLELVDESLRLFGPDGFGDGHLLGDHSLTPKGRENGWSGFTFETFTWKPRKAFYKLGADYVYPQYSIYMKDHEFFMEGTEFFENKIPFTSNSFRPTRSDSIYQKVGGKWCLTDTLTGSDGYKRVKIYTLRS